MKLRESIDLAARVATRDPELERTVAGIVEDVRRRGDEAVAEYAERFDGASGPFEIVGDAWTERAAATAAPVAAALERAAGRIRRFHAEQRPAEVELDGGEIALRPISLARVGLYVPGGTALYPSSVLMNAIPAAVAGVDEVVMVTPNASPEALCAASLAGVDRVFEIGGAHAVAALAYGTATIPRVDKIVGPGNRYVAEAKRQLFGVVDIDSVAGPSEVLIVADETADPRWIAADLLAQAEHDTHALPVLVCTSASLIAAVEDELDRQLASLPRAAIARAALENGGAAVLVADVRAAIELAESYAPEHLELLIADASAIAKEIRNAGAIFVGPHSPEAAGDYMAGPNHVLPTSGSARFASPLGVYDFIKYTSIIELSRDRLAELRGDIIALASVERLDAHGRSVAIRFDDDNDDDNNNDNGDTHG